MGGQMYNFKTITMTLRITSLLRFLLLVTTCCSLATHAFTAPAPSSRGTPSQRFAHVRPLAAKKKIAVGIVGPGLVGGELLSQIEATSSQLEKQGLDVMVTAISELKLDADGVLQPWMICSDKTVTFQAFKDAIQDPAAGQRGDSWQWRIIFNRLRTMQLFLIPLRVRLYPICMQDGSKRVSMWLHPTRKSDREIWTVGGNALAL